MPSVGAISSGTRCARLTLEALRSGVARVALGTIGALETDRTLRASGTDSAIGAGLARRAVSADGTLRADSTFSASGTSDHGVSTGSAGIALQSLLALSARFTLMTYVARSALVAGIALGTDGADVALRAGVTCSAGTNSFLTAGVESKACGFVCRSRRSQPIRARRATTPMHR